MANVLISKVGYAFDGALLDGPLLFVFLIEGNLTDFEAALLVFGDNLGIVYLDFFHLKSTSDDVYIVLQVVLEIRVFLTGFPQAEDVVFLSIPDVAFVQCLDYQSLLILLHVCFMCRSYNWLQMYILNS